MIDINKFFKINKEEEHECECGGSCGENCSCDGDCGCDCGHDLVESDMEMVVEEPMIESIPIRYLEGATELVVNPKGNCVDVYAYEDVFIPYMGYAMISLGFAMQLPEGKIAKLYPRSSTFKTWGM